MEPTNYGNRMAPLRASPPRTQNQQETNQNLTDEERYEQRRQDELRRQIRAKEQELEQISNSKERFRQRIERTLGLTGSFAEIPRAQDSALSKKSPAAFDYQTTFKPQETRQRYPHVNVERQSPLRQTQKYGTTQPVSSFQIPEPKPRPYAPKGGSDYASQLLSDNQQLQRRLNLVVAELDRVNREKQTTQNRLAQTMDETDALMHNLQNEESDDQHLSQLNHEVNVVREDNRRIQSDIRMTDQLRSESLNRLRMLQAERERRVVNGEDLSEGLVRKLSLIKDLEKEIGIVRMKIDDIQRQIPAIHRQNQVEDHSLHDMHVIIERLMRERDDLMAKLQHLNHTYDQTVSEISRERAQLESHNRRHTQLLTSKVMFQSLEAMVLARKQASLNEFFNYCRFDEKCHKTLKNLAEVMQRSGRHQMKMALKKWFRIGLEPVDVIKQKKALVQKFKNQFKKIISFNSSENNKDQGKFKEQRRHEACMAIWQLKNFDLWKEKTRYFTVWRDRVRLQMQQEIRLNYIVKRQTSSRLRIALNVWRNYNFDYDQIVRLHIMKSKFAQDQLELISLNQLKFSTDRHRRIRLMKLKHLFKGWQDGNKYRKYMMGQTVMANNMLRTLKLRLTLFCFNALRYNKESEKYTLVSQKLNTETAPAIVKNHQVIGQESVVSLRNEKIRKLDALAKQVQIKVGSYFFFWRTMTDDKRIFILKNIHEIILRKYLDTSHQAFAYWKNGNNHRQNTNQQDRINHISQQNLDLTEKVRSLNIFISTEEQRQKTRSRVKLSRGCDIFSRRVQRWGVRKLRAQCQMLTDKENAAKYLANLVRIAKCKQAFKQYCMQIEMKRQDEKDEARALFFNKTREMRQVRKHFNALCVYVTKFKKSKDYWNIILTMMNCWIKKRALQRWSEGASIIRAQQLQIQQNVDSSIYEQRTTQLRTDDMNLQQKKQENKGLKNDLHKQARNNMAMYFGRLYYTRCQARFLKWKQNVDNQKHRERLIQKFYEHGRRHKFYFIKAAFQNWAHKAKVQETKVAIRQSQIGIEEQLYQNEFKLRSFQDQKLQLEQEVSINDALGQLHGNRAQYLLSAIIRKNDVNYYQSNKRHIFGVWIAYLQRQKRFVFAINNVLRKSALQSGFDNVNAFSRDKNQTRCQNHALKYFFMIIQKNQTSGAFSKWKTYRLDAINEDRINTDNERIRRVQKHEYWRQKVRDHNCVRAANVIRKFRLFSLMKGWKNVVKHYNQIKACTKQKADQWLAYNTRRAVKKWFERKHLTIKVRGHHDKVKEFQRLYRLRMCFNAIKTVENNTKQYCNRLAELAKRIDFLQLQSAYFLVKNFKSSKDQFQARQKKQAATDLINALHEIYLRKMAQNMSVLRVKVINQKRRSLLLLGMLNGKWISRLRKALQKWKYSQQRISTVIEVNEEGPVVEEVLDHQITHKNLKGFMQHQGYTQSEIDDVLVITKNKAREGLARTVARWKAFKGSNGLYLKPKMFDRWRAFVQFKKLVRFHLYNMHNKLKPVKADLSIAFNRWKFSTGKSHIALNGLDKSVLEAKCADNARKVSQLADRSNETEEYLGHMGLQRDELVVNYMKSQRLAIAVGRDNLERGMAKGVSAMSDNMNAQKRAQFEEILQRNIHLIASLKDRIRDFEMDNESIANENEELRQFSLDGYQIAKNVQSLSNERERLSVDLADKANTIRRLLDENEALNFRLRDAQQHAANLIQQSNHNLRTMQRQTAGY